MGVVGMVVARLEDGGEPMSTIVEMMLRRKIQGRIFERERRY